MAAGIVKFTTNEPQFSAWVTKYSHAANISIEAAFEAQGRFLCDRLMKLTPPLSGKSIKKALWMRDLVGQVGYKANLISMAGGDLKVAFEKYAPFRSDETESLGAKKMGERRVEKDIRRVIKGVHGAVMPRKEDPRAHVIISQTNPHSANHSAQVEWGVRQKCQGKDAIRIYADRSGNVYGVDTEKFLPNPSTSDLAKIHNEHRGKRGRVTTAGSKDIIVGRWRWLNIVVAPFDAVQAYIEKKKLMVGQGRGGWAAGFKAFGGKISEKGWIGRHIKAGKISGWPPKQPGVINVSITNNSAWASNGDPDRIIENSIAGRERDMEKAIQIILENTWGAGAAGYDVRTKK
ncbi:MAG: hypothetical protein WCH99_08885 [Verrucomicrobiota bacterium]